MSLVLSAAHFDCRDLTLRAALEKTAYPAIHPKVIGAVVLYQRCGAASVITVEPALIGTTSRLSLK